MEILNWFDEDEEIDLEEIERARWEAHEALIEELEERQHDSGFYAFQDTMDMWRRER